MHELSIAMSIIDECARQARGHGSDKVNTVFLKLGPLSGVVADALRFSYELACEGTALAGSTLVIVEVPVVVYCETCKAEKTLPSIQHFSCPTCHNSTPKVLSGRELQISAIEIEDAHDPAGQAGNSELFREVSL